MKGKRRKKRFSYNLRIRFLASFISMKIFVAVVLFCGLFYGFFFFLLFLFPHSLLLNPKFIFFKKSIWLLCYGSPHKAVPTLAEASKSYQMERVFLSEGASKLIKG